MQNTHSITSAEKQGGYFVFTSVITIFWFFCIRDTSATWGELVRFDRESIFHWWFALQRSLLPSVVLATVIVMTVQPVLNKKERSVEIKRHLRSWFAVISTAIASWVVYEIVFKITYSLKSGPFETACFLLAIIGSAAIAIVGRVSIFGKMDHALKWILPPVTGTMTVFLLINIVAGNLLTALMKNQ
jgi:hypothetical protein